jgi:hypothetical protein
MANVMKMETRNYESKKKWNLDCSAAAGGGEGGGGYQYSKTSKCLK